MWDSVLAQFGLLGGLETLIRSWQIRLVFVCLFLLHNWMFDCFDSKAIITFIAVKVRLLRTFGPPQGWPFLQTVAKWFFPLHFLLWFCHSGHNSFFKGWLPVQIIQIFRLWCFWYYIFHSYFCFPRGFVGCTFSQCTSCSWNVLIWGGAKSGSSACSCKWCSQMFSVA